MVEPEVDRRREGREVYSSSPALSSSSEDFFAFFFGAAFFAGAWKREIIC